MSSYYPNTHAIWNTLAVAYEEKFMDLQVYNGSYDAFCAALKNDSPTVLEIGCGPGNISKYLLRQKPHMHLLGTDISESMVELAQKNVPQATFKTLDCRDILSLNQQFDGIICGFCIPYITPEDCEKLIEDCSTLLKPNGTLYISFVAGERHQSGEKTNSRGEKMHFEYYTEAQLATWLDKYGFGKIEFTKVPYIVNGELVEYHTIVLANKSL